jgi:hypothetical protein
LNPRDVRSREEILSGDFGTSAFIVSPNYSNVRNLYAPVNHLRVRIELTNGGLQSPTLPLGYLRMKHV